jgi:hypothetical protein
MPDRHPEVGGAHPDPDPDLASRQYDSTTDVIGRATERGQPQNIPAGRPPGSATLVEVCWALAIQVSAVG